MADAGLQTIGIDADVDFVSGLNDGHAPLFEPGLDDLIRQGMNRGRLCQRCRYVRSGLGGHRYAG
jgi:UDPglucose 6-dehydrogenase